MTTIDSESPLRIITPSELVGLTALRDQTAFLWLWGWAEEPSSFADGLGGAFDIAVLEAQQRHPTAVVIGHRRAGDVWIIAAPEDVEVASHLVSAIADRWYIDRLWLDVELWRTLVADGALVDRIRPGARHQRWYSQLEAKKIVRGGRGQPGLAELDEITALRALDAEQYGNVVNTLDYRSMIGRKALWVCRDRKRLVSSLKLVRVGERYANISSLWTRSSDRRRGFARRLVGEVVERSWKDEKRRCVLNVADTNQAALSLYERLGFETQRRMLNVDWRRDAS